jgi:hypothetical protein
LRNVEIEWVGTYEVPYFGARITAATHVGLFLGNDNGSIVFENPTGGKSESYSIVFSVFFCFILVSIAGF